MHRFKRILVALDLTNMDKHLMRYIRYMQEAFAPTDITLAHIVPHSLYAAQFFSDPVVQIAKAAVKESLDTFPDLGQSGKVRVEVAEGNPVRELLQLALKLKVDLIVVGLKKHPEGSGVVPRRLIRRAPCPILFVTRMKAPRISHVWVPVDFSRPSVRALKYAEYLMRKAKDVRITASHAVYLPAVLVSRSSWTKGQERQLLDSAKKSFDKFITSNNLDGIRMSRVITRGELENPASDLLEEAKASHADMIVISPEGHSKVDQLLVGSVTEKLLNLNHEIPTLVLK
jgi:nucleotide-binding universal stress UspA family protein